jgi:GTP pyrophosphokinase
VSTSTSAQTLGDSFDRAIVYALHIHAAQRRKETSVPYSAHLLGVCSIALEFGATETEAIGALLHDAVEDCGGPPQLEAIRSRFGDAVAAIVQGCSDSFETDPGARKAPWYDRKRAYIDGLPSHAAGDASILLVSASDKLYNLLATYNDVRRAGQTVYSRFNAKKFGTLWYYRALSDAFQAYPGRHFEAAGRLGELVDELAGKSTTASELLAAFAIDSTVAEREKGALAGSVATPVA